MDSQAHMLFEALIITIASIISSFYYMLVKGLRQKYIIEPRETDLCNKSEAELKELIRHLRTQISTRHEQTERLERKLKEAGDKSVVLTSKLNDAQSKIAALEAGKILLEKQLIHLENVRKSLIEELSGFSEKIVVSAAEAMLWELLISEVKQVLHSFRLTKEELVLAVSNLDVVNQEKDKLKKENQDLIKKFDEKRNELTRTQKDTYYLRLERDELEREVYKLQSKNQQLSKIIEELKESVERAKRTIGELNDKISNQSCQDMEQLSCSFRLVKGDLALAVSNLDMVIQEKDKLKKENQGLIENLTKKGDELVESQKELRCLRLERDELEREAYELQNKNQQLSKIIEQLKESVERAKRTIGELNDKISNQSCQDMEHSEGKHLGLVADTLMEELRASTSHLSNKVLEQKLQAQFEKVNFLPISSPNENLNGELQNEENDTCQKEDVESDSKTLEFLNDELQNLVDYLYFQLEKLRQAQDREGFLEDFYEHVGDNIW